MGTDASRKLGGSSVCTLFAAAVAAAQISAEPLDRIWNQYLQRVAVWRQFSAACVTS